MSRLLSAALILIAAGPLAAQQTVFRGGGDTVRVYVTVNDGDRLVTTLTREQFEVRDNGTVQPITIFDNSPQPIQLIVMIDVSGSMSRNLPLVRAAAEALFARLGPDDVARVGTFGTEIAISPTFTNDREALRAALPTEIPESAPTPLWSALLDAMAAFDDADARRRVVLVLSDGHDQPVGFRRRIASQIDVIDGTRERDVMVYAVGMRGRVAAQPAIGPGGLGAMLTAGMPDPGLGRVAVESGGGYLELRGRDNLGAAFASVMDELHSQYLIGFAPPARDGKKHDLDVRVSERGLKVRARKSYVAPRKEPEPGTTGATGTR